MRARSAFAAGIVLILAASVAVRLAWLRSDPPTFSPVGIIWHDEGAWVHNARNKVLWGDWQTDRWNPVFVTPVFTALEYGAFRAFGVGLWQARTVPAASGVIAVAFLMLGLAAYTGRAAVCVGGALLALNYVFVMWNRAALIESTMTAFMVVAWAAVARSHSRPIWGLTAGTAAVLAWFTKASAAFFVAAVVVNALIGLARAEASPGERRAAVWTLGGIVVPALALVALFVWPYWTEYQFYNWQMSVLRKPEYTIPALLDRASWLPVVQGTFSRMLPVLVVAAGTVVATASRGWRAHPADRLLVLGFVLGLAELVVHDSGNERRYLMFVPMLIALAARGAALTEPVLAPTLASAGRVVRALGALLVLALGYLVIGSACRILFEEEVTAGRLSIAVRLAAGVSALLAGAAWWYWRPIAVRLGHWFVPRTSAAVMLAAAVAWNVPDYAGWLRHRDDKNYEASVALGRLLPPGTLVHGKLANGLSLENQIRPIFVGNGFGNFEDRFSRDDVRYLLTYDLPRIGYESSDGSGLIDGILAHYPRHHVVASFEVDEAPGIERAVLIDKGTGNSSNARLP